MQLNISETSEISRVIIVSDIDNDTSSEVIKSIESINELDAMREKTLKEYQRQPIKMIIQSFGGSVHAGFAIIAAIRTSTTPIVTINYGMTMSMGFIIFLFGDVRLADKYSTFMWHDITTGEWDKLETVKDNVKESQRLVDLLIKITIEKTRIKRTQLDKIIKTKADWYIEPTEAVRLGICSDVI
jgi:ATP-dependent Clp protease protease subunit